jgi:hypothetical protein
MSLPIGRLVGNAHDACRCGHEHRVGHAVEHAVQVVARESGRAQGLAHVLEGQLQLAELVAPGGHQRLTKLTATDLLRGADQSEDRTIESIALAPEPEARQHERQGCTHA